MEEDPIVQSFFANKSTHHYLEIPLVYKYVGGILFSNPLLPIFIKNFCSYHLAKFSEQLKESYCQWDEALEKIYIAVSPDNIN